MGKIPENETSPDDHLTERLIALRRARGLSLQEVELASGIARATLSRIERGGNSPTAEQLGRLCAVYQLTMSQLFTDLEHEQDTLNHYASATRWIDPATGFERVILSPPAKGFAVEIMEGTLPSGALISYTRSPIDGLEQHIILLEGKLHLTFKAQTYELDQPNDCLRLKLYGPSRFHNPGLKPCRYLIVQRKPS